MGVTIYMWMQQFVCGCILSLHDEIRTAVLYGERAIGRKHVVPVT